MHHLTAEGRRAFGPDSFTLHILAMAFMLCDHLWGTFLGRYDLLAYLGRIAFPLFAFMLVEGFFHTGDRRRYALRLLIFALISELPFNLLVEHRLFYPLHQNVLWTFLLGIGFLSVCQRIQRGRHLVLRLFCYGAVTVAFYLLAILTFVDYYGAGLLMIATFYFTRTADTAPVWKKVLAGLLQLILLWWINTEHIAGLVLSFQIFGLPLEIYKQNFSLLALPLIWLYTGKQGPYNKGIRQLYYWFYPVHMAILGGLITLL